jgi:hypothetical protein
MKTENKTGLPDTDHGIPPEALQPPTRHQACQNKPANKKNELWTSIPYDHQNVIKFRQSAKLAIIVGIYKVYEETA